MTIRELRRCDETKSATNWSKQSSIPGNREADVDRSVPPSVCVCRCESVRVSPWLGVVRSGSGAGCACNPNSGLCVCAAALSLLARECVQVLLCWAEAVLAVCQLRERGEGLAFGGAAPPAEGPPGPLSRAVPPLAFPLACPPGSLRICSAL